MLLWGRREQSSCFCDSCADNNNLETLAGRKQSGSILSCVILQTENKTGFRHKHSVNA